MPNARILNTKPNTHAVLGVNLGSITTTAVVRTLETGSPIGLLLVLTYSSEQDVVESTTVTTTAGKPNARIITY